jgi:hypothetical protein
LTLLLSRLEQNRPAWVATAFLLLLALTWTAFRPGLGGDLIFDDIPNLQPWKDFGDLDTPEKVLGFAASGADTPGRPLSLLSFVMDDQSWKPDIHSLKRTNLALHLINTSLVLWLALLVFRRLLTTLDPQAQAVLALFAAGLWALHPLQVSNVSYVIQRMNLLSTLLELAGMVLFMHGRAALATSTARGLALCTAAAGLMPIAILAKENGLLLCAFLLLIEGFCFAPDTRRFWRYWKLLFLWTPLVLFTVYCLVHYRGFTVGFQSRDFTAWERLLTQGPVLADYLGKLLLPRLQGTGLYFDNFPVSRSLLDPIGTLPAWLLLSGLLALAWYLRHRQKVVAFGIFFYFVGHLMESTVLPLELYYEHRNYLPQAGLWIALTGLLGQVRSTYARQMLAGTGIILLGMLLLLSRSNAALWSDSRAQSAIWYHENPGSLRSTLSYANLLLQAGQLDELDKLLEEARHNHPDSLAIVVSQRFVRCYWRDLPTRFDDLPALAERADYEIAGIMMLQQMRDIAKEQSGTLPTPDGCQPASNRQISNVFLGLLRNPLFASGRIRAGLMEFIADTAIEERDLNTAMRYYDGAFAGNPLAIFPYRQALLLESAGLPEEARTYLDISAAAVTTKQRLLYPDLERRIAELRTQLDARKAGTQ